jgi:hypothetical protein
MHGDGAELVSAAVGVADLTQSFVALAPIPEVSATQERAEDGAMHADADTEMMTAQAADSEKLPDAEPADGADVHKVHLTPRCMHALGALSCLERRQHACLMAGVLLADARQVHCGCLSGLHDVLFVVDAGCQFTGYARTGAQRIFQ